MGFFTETIVIAKCEAEECVRRATGERTTFIQDERDPEWALQKRGWRKLEGRLLCPSCVEDRFGAAPNDLRIYC